MAARVRFPLVKLGAEFAKQLSKPLAAWIKTRAKNNAYFRNKVCLPVAQGFNYLEHRYKAWVADLGVEVKLLKLTEPMALDLGANILGEAIIFLVAACVIIYEYIRSHKKETKKEELLKQERAEMQQNVKDLLLRVEKIEKQIQGTRVSGSPDLHPELHLKKLIMSDITDCIK